MVFGIRSSSTTSTVTLHSLPSFSMPVTDSTGRPMRPWNSRIAPRTTSVALCFFAELRLELDDEPDELLLDPELDELLLELDAFLRELEPLFEPDERDELFLVVELLLLDFDFDSATWDHLG